MFIQYLLFEIRNRLFRLSSFVYFVTYFLLTFLWSICIADAFQGITLNIGLSSKLALNSSIVLNNVISIIGFFGFLIVAPIFARSIYKDFETGFKQIIFSTPISKRTYFFVRYFASLIVVIILFSSIGFGAYFATLMPFVNKDMIIQNHISFYIAPYLYNIIPNVAVFGSLFIFVVAIFRKMTPVYVLNIFLFIVSMACSSFLADIDNKFLASLLEPFGFIASSEEVRYWPVAEQSCKLIPFTRYLLYNRLFWGFIGSILLFIGYMFFDPLKLTKEKKDKSKRLSKFIKSKNLKISLKPNSFKILLDISISEFKQAFSNSYFLVFLLLGIIYLLMISSQIGKIYGTETLPVTYHVLEGIWGPFQLFILMIITYYTAELVWKDRDCSFYEITDSKPISNLFLYLSKLSTLVLIQLFFSFIILITCLTIQIINKYYFFEWKIYFQELFFYFLLQNILTCILVLFIHTISKNKYLAHFIVFLYYVLSIWLPRLGFDHNLYLIGSIPQVFYSDMNKFGTSLYPFMIFTLYWTLFYIILAYLTVLFWRRGITLGLKDTIAGLKSQSFKKSILIGSTCSWIAIGGFIYYNTNVLNIYKTKATVEKEAVDYEKKYKKIEKIEQPKICSVKVNLELFPEKQSMKANGVFKYKNYSKEPISQIFLNTSNEANINLLAWNKIISFEHYDKIQNVNIYDLAQPLKPDEEIELTFQLDVQPKGFKNSGFSTKIVENGTFFNSSDFFPIIGYNNHKEIFSEKIRKKYNLTKKNLMNALNNEKARNKTYLSQEGSWIDFEATISTSKDQIAITCGDLVNQWEQNDRKFYHYKASSSILPLYAFLSGRYEVATANYKNIKIEIFHHSNHNFNISRMINSIKKSLEYYTANFSPYQFKQVRIIEFPRYNTFAQSFPNTIPYSESLGFIAKIKDNDPKNIDYVFYVTAHEVAHQWWAHQVVGADVQGSTMLSESLAQYSALMVQEKEYGPEQMKKFLKYEMDKYLYGRSTESAKELPLMLNENQEYIHYNKGSLIFYALKDYLGEDTVNSVLKEYIQDVSFQKPPFTYSLDLVKRFKRVTPEDKKYLIEDFFETITLYSNRTKKVTYTKNKDKYDVTIVTENKKFRADDLGNEKEISMCDYIDIGIFDKKGNSLYLQKHIIKSGENIFHIQVDNKPHKAGIDPINKLIDKESKGHLLKATEIKKT